VAQLSGRGSRDGPYRAGIVEEADRLRSFGVGGARTDGTDFPPRKETPYGHAISFKHSGIARTVPCGFLTPIVAAMLGDSLAARIPKPDKVVEALLVLAFSFRGSSREEPPGATGSEDSRWAV
jgi:hypothetical protein